MAAKARVHIHNRQASRIWHALPQRDFIIRSNVTTPCPISNQAYLPRELDTNSPTVWANANTVNAPEHESARISPWGYEVYGLVLPVSVKQPYKPFAPEGSIDIAAVSQGRNYFTPTIDFAQAYYLPRSIAARHLRGSIFMPV